MKLRSGLLAFFIFVYIAAQASDKFYFIIRIDDIQSRNMTMIPRTITDFEKAVEERSGRISWTVIPHRLIEDQNKDGQLAADLLNSVLKGHEIVPHGYNHICPLCNQSSHEMYCTYYNQPHSYATQEEMIINSLQILKDSINYVPKSFVPPGHHADTTTYKVLVDYNFDMISTTALTKENIYKNLYNLKPHNEYTWYLTQNDYNTKLNAALTDIENRFQTDGYYCLLLHDPFIRKGYENGLVIEWTSELLDSLSSRYRDEIEFKTLSEAAGIFNAITVLHDQFTIISENYNLHQNYPNPFNPSTVIEFILPAEDHVELTVHNISGERVSQLVDEIKNAGRYKVQFSSGNISSGVYFYTLQTNNFRQTKKMILLR